MNYDISLLSIVLIVGICLSENTAKNDTLSNKTVLDKSTIEQNDSFSTLGFEATVQSIQISTLSSKLRAGVDYKQSSINDFSDTCEIIIGIDANYLVILKDIKFTENMLKLKKPRCLFLRIHSPAITFAGFPETGKMFAVQLQYHITKDSDISFIDINAIKKAK